MIRHQLRQHARILSDVITPSVQRRIAVLLQGDFFGSTPAFKQSYAPQSGEIFGILENMLDTFKANLENAQKEEADAQRAFDELKAAKEAEIAAGQAQIDTKLRSLLTLMKS